MILLDDAARPGERLVARRWQKRWPQIDFAFDRSGTKGTLIGRSEEHTSELQSLMRISYAVFCLKKKTINYRSTATKKQNLIYIKSNITHNTTIRLYNYTSKKSCTERTAPAS